MREILWSLKITGCKSTKLPPMKNTNLSSGSVCDYQFYLNDFCAKMSKTGEARCFKMKESEIFLSNEK